MLETELREPVHCHPVFLVDPREFQPEFPLGDMRCRVAAGHEEAQSSVPVSSELLHAGLQGRQLFGCAT